MHYDNPITLQIYNNEHERANHFSICTCSRTVNTSTYSSIDALDCIFQQRQCKCTAEVIIKLTNNKNNKELEQTIIQSK